MCVGWVLCVCRVGGVCVGWCVFEVGVVCVVSRSRVTVSVYCNCNSPPYCPRYLVICTVPGTVEARAESSAPGTAWSTGEQGPGASTPTVRGAGQGLGWARGHLPQAGPGQHEHIPGLQAQARATSAGSEDTLPAPQPSPQDGGCSCFHPTCRPCRCA